jgi:hypothetical protein
MAGPFIKKYAAVLSTPVVLVLILAVVALALSQSLLGHAPLTLGLQAAGILLMIWARLTFGLRSTPPSSSSCGRGSPPTGACVPPPWAS